MPIKALFPQLSTLAPYFFLEACNIDTETGCDNLSKESSSQLTLIKA